MKGSILFIDANQYLTLFGTPTGKKLLRLLDDQKEHVFITGQVVDEVLRNKLRLAQRFFSQILKDFTETKVAIPDHLLGIKDQKLKALRETFKNAEDARSVIRDLTIDVLRTISQSTDEVSRQLQPLFDQAVAHSVEELLRARERRERGNPPGKPHDPLGDQISWEQLLTRCRASPPKTIWIATADQDYHTKSGGKLFLNPLLNRDLVAACGGQPEVHCLDDFTAGLAEFAKSVGVDEARLPTAEEAKQIRKENDIWIVKTSPVMVAGTAPVVVTNPAWNSDELAASLKRQVSNATVFEERRNIDDEKK